MLIEKDKIMNPTNDYVFHRLFGYARNEEITKGLIGTIVNQNINTIKMDETQITEQNIKDDKIGILDIRARLNNDIVCDVEMQVVKNDNMEKRIMFYWSKLYSQEIHKGEDYDVLHKTIVILIANFKLEKLKEIPKFHTKWQIREEEYRKIILTDTLEIHIIELPKLIKQLNGNKGDKKEKSIILNPENIGDEDMEENEDRKNNNEEKLMLWSLFLLNPDAISDEDLQKNEDIRKAKEELEKIRQDKQAQRLAELRMKYVLDQNSIRNSGFREGMKKGIKEGIKEGIREGQKSKQLEIAKKLLNLKMPISQIIQVTGLTEEEIKNI